MNEPELIYVHHPNTVFSPILQCCEYQTIFESTHCSLSGARYKLLLGMTGLGNVSYGTKHKLAHLIDCTTIIQDDARMKRAIVHEIECILRVEKKLSVMPWSTGLRSFFRKTPIQWELYIERIRNRLTFPISLPLEVPGIHISLYEIVARVLLITSLCMERYLGTKEVWFIQAVNRLHTHPIMSRLLRRLYRSNHGVRRLLQSVHYEFQRFKTMERLNL
jgi:hypothetical protein